MANCRDMFESRISAGAKEKLPTRANLMQKQDLLSPTTWKVTKKKCVERYCELANKTTQQIF